MILTMILLPFAFPAAHLIIGAVIREFNSI